MERVFRFRRCLFGVVLMGLVTGCGDVAFVDNSPLVEAVLNDAESYFHIPFENYPADVRSLPIGVFDSGTGGLTVLDAIVRYDGHDNETHATAGDGVGDFREESFIYLADQANMPYGVYDREGKTDLLREHILKDVQFLLGNRYYRTPGDEGFRADKSSVKAVVIACNTATAYGKADIEAFLTKAGLDVPVIGVIDAGVRGALDAIDADEDGTVAVFATMGTVSSNGYVNAFHEMMEDTGYSGDVEMIQQAGLGLASAVDGVSEYIIPQATAPREGYEGPSETHTDATIELSILPNYDFDWEDGAMLFEGDLANPSRLQINSVRNYIAYHVVSLLEKMRRSEDVKPLKTVILGCTHYPFYTDVFREEFERLYDYRENDANVYRDFLVEEIEIIDPAENTARELYDYLKATSLFNNGNLCQSEFYISMPNVLNASIETDADDRFTFEYKYGRAEGVVQEYVKRVPFSRRTIGPATVDRLARAMPEVFEMMECFTDGKEKTTYLEDKDRF